MLRVESGDWSVENGEWIVENGVWNMEIAVDSGVLSGDCSGYWIGM